MSVVSGAATLPQTASSAAVAAAHDDDGDDGGDNAKTLVQLIGLIVFSIVVFVGVVAICCTCIRWCRVRGRWLFRYYVRYKTRDIDLSCGVRMWAEVSFLLSAFT